MKSTDQFFMDRLLKRLMPFKDLIGRLGIKQFYVGGSVFLESYNDVDVYFQKYSFESSSLLPQLREIPECNIIVSTANAITVRFNNKILQFCRYEKESIEELIDSFDFAHTQIGASVLTDSNEKDYFLIAGLYYTEAFKTFRMTGETHYTGTEYPLSSLVRIFKYKKYFIGRSYIIPVIQILNDIISRGYYDYGDFLDQLNAVDIGLLPEEINDAQEDLVTLFNLLEGKGNAKPKYEPAQGEEGEDLPF